MARVTYIEPSGTEHVVDVELGLSLMKAAVDNGVPGIEAICGGQCACATCHCYVDAAWFDRVPEMDELENEMLDDVNAGRRANSRLSCQIRATADLDGLVVRLPDRQ